MKKDIKVYTENTMIRGGCPSNLSVEDNKKLNDILEKKNII
jgi:hypothetical protein